MSVAEGAKGQGEFLLGCARIGDDAKGFLYRTLFMGEAWIGGPQAEDSEEQC
jgi:hypothetical protein